MSKTQNTIKHFCSVALLLLTGFLSSCITTDDGPKQANDPLSPGNEIKTTLMGTVVNEAGKPLEGVNISVNGETATTSVDGSFLMEGIKIPGSRCVIKAEKEGYFNSIKAFDPKNKNKLFTQIVLMGNGTTHTIDAAVGGKATLENGSEVQIPANSVVTSSGEAYSGNIKMAVRYMNPIADGFGSVVPGGDMLARRSDASTSILYSYGILRVLLKGESDEDLQIAAGKESTIIMTIPTAQLATAPATIPLWFFDEKKGFWVEEGAAQKEGNQYIGTVKHFTDWNCDDPKRWATIVGKLVDCNGYAAGGKVGFGQVTSDIVTDTDASESTGKFEMRVPTGITIPVVIQNPLSLPDPDKNSGGKVIVIVPPLSEGQVYDVGDLMPHPCTSTLKGRFKSSRGETVNSMSLETNKGSMVVSTTSQSFTLRGIPAQMAVTATIKTSSGKTITKQIETPEPSATLDLGEINLDVDVTVGDNSFVIDGDGFNNQKFTFNSQYEPKGWFTVNENMTEIRLGGLQENLEFSLHFEGNSLNATTAMASSLKITDRARGTLNYYNKSQSPIQITITRYDLVGGLIEGKYSGTYQRWENGKLVAEASVTEGEFSVTRVDE